VSTLPPRTTEPSTAKSFRARYAELIGKFRKTRWAIPTGIGAAVGLNTLALWVVPGLATLLIPFATIAALWYCGVRRGRFLLLFGFISILLFTLPYTAITVTGWQAIEPEAARSLDGTLFNGTVTPFNGPKDAIYTYRILALPGANVTEAYVNISRGFAFETDKLWLERQNGTDPLTNAAIWQNTTDHVDVINGYLFVAKINGTWVEAGGIRNLVEVVGLLGPINDDTWVMAGAILPFALAYVPFSVGLPFFVLVGLIWWLRRMRRVREEQWAKAQGKRAPAGRHAAKEPDLRTTTEQVRKEGVPVQEGYFCTECGADVPADATSCPNCGEKFD